jgi:FkbM family methyltransferase
MIIDNNYIISRIFALKREQQPVKKKGSLRPHYLFYKSPLWLKKIMYLLRNPLYACYRGGKQAGKVLKTLFNIHTIEFNKSVGLATNFIRYCMENTVYFDTHNFFPEEEDALIQRHIDYRIKTFIGASPDTMNEYQLESWRLAQKIKCSVKNRKGYYVLQTDNRKYYLSQGPFEISTWKYHYGLKQLPDEIKEYIANKDFLDIGAAIGDSALMFLQYQPKRIFAYEPVADTYQDLIKTIEREGCAKIHASNKGIGDKKTSMEIFVRGNSSTLLSNYGANNNLSTEKIEITTIDSECRDKKVGLIKMDVEGFEYFAIKGGLETIKRDKPVLLISIYHTGKDFFEIPPIIKSCVPEYTFRYLDLSPYHPVVEKVLAGYIN